MELTLRPAAAADVDRLCAIAVQAWERIHDTFIADVGEELHAAVCGDWRLRKAAQIRRHCEAHPEWVLAAERDGAVIGFVTYRLDHHRALGIIGNNAVAPEAQGQGVATRMYARVLDSFRAEGMRFAEVATGLDEGHAPARRAYEKVGFDLRREDVTYYLEL